MSVAKESEVYSKLPLFHNYREGRVYKALQGEHYIFTLDDK